MACVMFIVALSALTAAVELTIEALERRRRRRYVRAFCHSRMRNWEREREWEDKRAMSTGWHICENINAKGRCLGHPKKESTNEQANN